MRNFVIRVIVNALALQAAAWFIPGIQLSGGFGDVMLVALLFGLVNALLKPIVFLFSLPFVILTLGLFALVVNGVMLWVTAGLTTHLAVSGLLSAILGSIVISLVTMVLGGVLKDDEKD